MSVIPSIVEIDGIRWIEINRAAKFSATKATLIAKSIEDGSIDSEKIDGKIHIHLGVAQRLRREARTMMAVRKLAKTAPKSSATGRVGVLSAHREKQSLLPMSSGRKGRGWKS